ncbi:MAG TPA: hypothetical protein VE130_14790 [Nitrososphaeraceae archaeon]|nr:hypothetical protein [Nitrososphaeraceae archaeon]
MIARRKEVRHLDDRIVSLCLDIIEHTESCHPKIIEAIQRFGCTNNDEAMNALVSWKIHFDDRIQEEYDKNGWMDEFNDKPGSVVPYRHLRLPLDIQAKYQYRIF